MTKDIVPIITICVTLILGVGGFIVNSFIQRKSHSIQVITKTRLERRFETKRIMAVLAKYSDFEYLNSITIKEHAIIIDAVVTETSKLRSEYSYIFNNDSAIVKSAYALEVAIVNYLKDASAESNNVLYNCRKNFLRIADVYMQTEWKRIKLETVGKPKKSKHSFEETYDSYDSGYKDE